MKQKFYFRFLFVAVLILTVGKANAQGVGNHITMSLENCAATSLNTFECDLIVSSDGTSSSDLRMNCVSFGLNYNTAILPQGATLTPSYISGTTDSIFLIPTFYFPTSSFPNHIKITEQINNGGNPGITMVIGHKYRAARIRLTGSANWIANSNPNFLLQNATAPGYTNCIALVYMAIDPTTTAINVTGTGDGQRSVNVACSMTLNPCGTCPPFANFQSSNTIICSATCINFYDFSTGNPTSWSWSFPGAVPDTSTQQNPTNICYSTPGIYPVTLVVSNTFGTDTLVISPMIKFGNQPAIPVITVVGGDTLRCSSAPYYHWYLNGNPTGGTDSFYIAPQKGTYSVVVSDGIGCSASSASVNVGYCSANFNLYPDSIPHTYTAVNTTTGISPIAYLWKWGDGTTDTAAYPKHTYSSAGYYTICLTIADSVGCISTYCDSFNLMRMDNNTMITINVIPHITTGVINENNLTVLIIYPNPLTSSSVLQFNTQLKDAEVIIYNMLGKEMIRSKLSGNRMEIEKGSLASGVYFVKVQDGGREFVQKIVVE